MPGVLRLEQGRERKWPPASMRFCSTRSRGPLVQFGRVAIDAGPSGPKRPGPPEIGPGSRARCFG